MMMKLNFSHFLPICLLFLVSCSSVVETDNERYSTIEIVIAVKDETHVKIWLENSYKTKVTTFIDEVMSAGSDSIYFFELEDNFGNPLPLGVYTVYFKVDLKGDNRAYGSVRWQTWNEINFYPDNPTGAIMLFYPALY